MPQCLGASRRLTTSSEISTAGLDHAAGDVVVTLDGDGQHPPELISEMIELHLAGYDVVLTQRVSAPRTRVKRWTSRGFYRLLARIGDTPLTDGSADYRLLARPVVEALRRMREYHRFLRGMVAWTGFRTVVLPYAEQPRIAGRAKYSLARMLRFAADATFSFSLVPLGIALNGTSSVLYATVADLVTAERRSRAYGLYYTLSIGASALGPTLYGFVGDAVGAAATLSLIALVVLTTIPLCLALRPAVAAPARS